MTTPKMELRDIKDLVVQENFKRLREFFFTEALLKCDLKFLEINIPAAITNYQYPHGLGFQPLDVLVLHNFSNATVSFNFAKFTDTNIFITSNASTVLRILIGRYS
jgi:hypothetical protein